MAILHYHGFDSCDIDLVDVGGWASWTGVVFDALPPRLEESGPLLHDGIGQSRNA